MKAKDLIEVLKDFPEYEVAVWDVGYGDIVPVNHTGTQGKGRRVLVLDHEYEVCKDCKIGALDPWSGVCGNDECTSGPDDEREPYASDC